MKTISILLLACASLPQIKSDDTYNVDSDDVELMPSPSSVDSIDSANAEYAFDSRNSRQIFEPECHSDGNKWYHAGWNSLGDAADEHEIHLTFALKQQNIDDLDDLFHSISNPQHEKYGQHLSLDEVNKLIRPHDDSLSTVRNWLLSDEFGLDEDDLDMRGDDFLTATVPVSTAEKMLQCNFHKFQNEHSKEQYIRSVDGYSLPSHIAPHVDFVGGVGRLHKGQLRAMSFSVKDSEAASSDIRVTPAVLRQLYNIPPDLKGTNSSNSQAVTGFLGQYFNPSDVEAYLKRNKLEPRSVERILGKNDINNPGSEATLDMQTIMGISPGVKTEFWSFSGLRDNSANASYWNQEPFLNWMLTIAASDSVPLVHSVSYDDDEYTLSHSYINRLNVEFRKAAVRGITLLFASGDDGIGGINVREQGSANCTKAVPAFPAGSPYVTSVGATMLDVEGKAEIVCSSTEGSSITTGGGFSNLFKMPSYQANLVNKYLQLDNGKHLPPDDYYNKEGRVFPDLSLIGNNYEYINGGKVHLISGTSASTPAFAGMVALLNDVRLNRGQSPLGFLNYWLYSLAEQYGWDQKDSAFNDIISGDNACSAIVENCCEHGFKAKPGYDPASGLGTPNIVHLLKHL